MSMPLPLFSCVLAGDVSAGVTSRQPFSISFLFFFAFGKDTGLHVEARPLSCIKKYTWRKTHQNNIKVYTWTTNVCVRQLYWLYSLEGLLLGRSILARD